jgi:hypothetical protein
LTEPNFCTLCEAALARPEDYCDYQLVSGFRKFAQLNNRHIKLLLRFFSRRSSYTRCLTLEALVQHGHAGCLKLAVQLWDGDLSWEATELEFARLTALEAFKNSRGGEALLAEYLLRFEERYDIEADAYRRAHLESLRPQ